MLFSLHFSFHSFGENSMGENVFLSCEAKNNINEKLEEAYRAFIFSTNVPSQKDLADIYSFLQNNEDELVILILERNNSDFSRRLEQHKVNQFLALPNHYSLNDIQNCKSKGKRLFVFTPNETVHSFSAEDEICSFQVGPDFPEDIVSNFIGKQENDLVIFRLDESLKAINDSIKKDSIPLIFNRFTGKLPNFFVTEHKNIFQKYHQFFSKERWYTANVLYNEKPLPGVTWSEMPLMKSFGKIHTTHNELSPHKDGFHFTPDVFSFNAQTSKTTKIFIAQPRDIKDEMVLHLAFEENIDNPASESTKIPYNKLEYTKDPKRGWCGVFNDPENYIDFDTEIVFDENFTVSAWVYPTEISGNRSIIGKGKALSIKFRDGNMLFTSPGIKDHVMDTALVTTDVWQHLVYVISTGNTVKFYKNGELVDEQIAERIEPTEHSLLVGTNLWDESFRGLMDDLIIWNRNLSDEEVKLLYKEGISENTTTRNRNFLWISIAIISILIALPILFSRRKRNSKNAFHGFRIPSNQDIKEPSIEFFGGFKIVNRNKEDLTSRFSPRRKQIFILVLIETLKKEGISSKQLTNLLWAGHTAESAKNNRSTHVQRIREILTDNSGINIAYSDKKWTINLEDDVYCDLMEFFYLIDQMEQKETATFKLEVLEKLLPIIEKGALLPNMDDEWLDNFKSKLSDDLLDLLTPFFSEEDFIKDSESVIRLSNALLIFDPLNETVLKHKIEALVKIGKNSQANESLEHFEKVYQQCYDEPFNKSISDLISAN